jgi:hypothetical protein
MATALGFMAITTAMANSHQVASPLAPLASVVTTVAFAELKESDNQ